MFNNKRLRKLEEDVEKILAVLETKEKGTLFNSKLAIDKLREQAEGFCRELLSYFKLNAKVENIDEEVDKRRETNGDCTIHTRIVTKYTITKKKK